MDIYAQRFDSTGARLGANFMVDYDPSNSDQYSPSVGIDPQGRMIILWNDWRDPRRDPQIYVQRYGPDGAPVGGNVIINDPNPFYYDHHWCMQHSVACGAGRWIFSWTENRRHRGWDTYNKITDWDLVAIAEPASVGAAAQPRLSLSVNPNPIRDRGRIRLALTAAAPTSDVRLAVDLFDAAGRRVMNLYQGLPGRAATLDLPVSTARIAAGTYFVVARRGQEAAIAKIIIQE